jgi:glycosyltransferase involved in cell wall biosynthesis
MILGSLAGIFIGKKYDYVFGFNMSALTSMMPAVVISVLYKKRLTLWVQDLWPESVYAYGFKKSKLNVWLLNNLVKFVYKYADAVAVSSYGFKEEIMSLLANNVKCDYIPNWAENLSDNVKPATLGLDDKIVHFTFAGNVGKMQNLENVVEAFSQLPINYRKRCQLNIIGDGSNINVIKNMSSNQSNIIFYGRKPAIEMSAYFKASHFLIISLINAKVFSITVPSKLQTYIAAKRPIIGIITGDTANIITENDLGLCADPDNLDNILDVFMRCIDMTEKQKYSFSKKNITLLQTVFNKEKIIDKLLKITINDF